MPEELQKINQDIAALKKKYNDVNRILNFHKHLGYDSTSVLKPIYRRSLLVDQATIVTDTTLSNHFYVTLKGNRTLATPTGMQPGQRIIFEFIQDGTGSRTITLDPIFDVGSFTVTLTTTINKRDFMEVVYSDVDNILYVINFVKNY